MNSAGFSIGGNLNTCDLLNYNGKNTSIDASSRVFPSGLEKFN